jgi:hypothetical protein
MGKLERNNREENRVAARFFCTLWLLNIPYLIATFIAKLGDRSPLVELMRLSSENNAGAWWSGMQLLLFGLLYLSASGELSKAPSELKRPLIVLGLVGLCLAADEMGSIHERVSLFGKEHFGSGKLALLPFAMVGVGAVGYSVWALYRERAAVGNVWWWVCIGFTIFGVVWVQEHIEHAYVFDRPFAKGLRASLEEGSELLGFSLLLTSGLLLRTRLGRVRGDASALFPSQSALRMAALLMLMAIVPVVLIRIPFTRVELDFPSSGDYGLTIPVQLFVISALIAVQLPGSDRKNMISWIIVGVIMAATSLAVLASYPNRTTWGTQVIYWRADIEMFLAVPVIAFGFLVAGLNRIRLTVFAGAVQCLVTGLILSKQEWGDWVAPYLVSVPVVVYLLKRASSLPSVPS